MTTSVASMTPANQQFGVLNYFWVEFVVTERWVQALVFRHLKIFGLHSKATSFYIKPGNLSAKFSGNRIRVHVFKQFAKCSWATWKSEPFYMNFFYLLKPTYLAFQVSKTAVCKLHVKNTWGFHQRNTSCRSTVSTTVVRLSSLGIVVGRTGGQFYESVLAII
jgi:hypothetical protein